MRSSQTSGAPHATIHAEGGDSIQARIKALSTITVIIALAALATPAQAGKGFLKAFFASTVVSSVKISTRASSEGSSYTTSERKRRARDPSSEQLSYFTDNYDAVMRDAAAGGGEHLNALGRLLGCSNDVRPQLSARTMAYHQRIFAFHRGDGQVDMNATLRELKRVLDEDPNLVERCRALHRTSQSSAAATLTAGASCTPRGAAMCHPQPL